MNSKDHTPDDDVARDMAKLPSMLAAGQADAALEILRRCEDRQPDNPLVLIQLGEVLRHTPDIVEGVQYLRKGLVLQPTNIVGWLSLGSALKVLDQPDGAQAAFRTALDLDPNRVEALNDLGTILMDRSEWAEAVTLFRRASDRAPAVVGIRLNLARALAQDGRVGEASDIARSIMSTTSQEAGAARRLLDELQRPRSFEETSHSLEVQRFNLSPSVTE